MLMKRYIIIFFILTIVGSQSFAQEYLTGLAGNPMIYHFNKENKVVKSTKIVYPKSLTLPFFDDFKQLSIFPDTSRWIDANVFINSNFAAFPPTWGIATFDALDATGQIYSQANSVQFVADYLTSKPIRLDSVFSPVPRALSPSDSVYFSFYFQPQGYGNDPQLKDSLVLEFGYYDGDPVFSYIDSTEIFIAPGDTVFPGDTLYSPCDPNWIIISDQTFLPFDVVKLPCDSVFVPPQTRWKSVWSHVGMTLDEFRQLHNESYFAQVMIPLLDTNWFSNGFQFRFTGYASIADDGLQSWQSNCDYWNIDYILLDINRGFDQTTHRDITFTGIAPSFLKDYSSMPFAQYRDDPNSAMNASIDMLISNLDNGNQTAEYRYEVKNDVGGSVYTYNGGVSDLFPFTEAGYCFDINFARPPVEAIFPPLGDRDSVYFDITHYLLGTDTQLNLGDTLTYRQYFKNYYAYDDGIPELGYGLTPAGAMLAYQFNLSKRDTLRAVQMFFNKTFSNANEQYFSLAVWKDLNGKPGDLAYLQEREKPIFGDSLFRFVTYHLDTAVPVLGTFYVGWIQETNHNLNIGFDANNNAGNRIFYNTTGSWENTSFQGALLIRPVMGKKLKESPVQKSASIDLFNLYPNPNHSGIISFKFLQYPKYNATPYQVGVKDEVLQQMEIVVYNLVGQKVYQSQYQPQIDLSALNEGIYLVQIIDYYHQQTMTEKLVLTK